MVNLEDIIQVLCLIIAVFSIVGNSLVCHVIIRKKFMKTGMNFLLLNLALLDTITGFLGISNIIVDRRSSLLPTSNLLEQVYNKSAIAAEVLCKVQKSYWFVGTTTPMLLMAIAYERYMAVVHPLTRRTGGVSKARLKWISAVCWLSAISSFVFDIVTFTYKEGNCDSPRGAGNQWLNFKVYSVVAVSVYFVIPAIVMFILYLRVIKALQNTAKTIGVQEEAQIARNKARRKVIIIVITVTVIFFVFCGIPNVSLLLLNFLNIWFSAGKETMLLLFLTNSVLNPVIYFTLMKSFRDALLENICRRGRETPQRNLIRINPISITPRRNGNIHVDNRLENEPKLLRISAGTSL